MVNIQKPQLTVGMVVYNEEKYIAQAIENILGQTYKDFVFLISDNASIDSTSKICHEYAQKDGRIKYVRHEKNMGTIANWKYVLDNANTPYLMLCAGHDKWHLQYIEKLLPAFKDSDVVLSYPNSAEITHDGNIGKTLADNYTTAHIENPSNRYLFFLKHNRAPNIFFSIWRVSAFRQCDFNLKSPNADILILEQAAFEGKFKQHPEVLFWLRTVRPEESAEEIRRRQLSAARGIPKEQISKFSIKILYIIFVVESIKIIFRKRYRLNFFNKIILLANVIYYRVIYMYSMYIIGSLIKITLGKKAFLKIKNFWHRRYYK